MATKMNHGTNPGKQKESETKKLKAKTTNVKGLKKRPKLTKKKNGVNVRIENKIILFLATHGKKIAVKIKHSEVHKCNIVTGPCHKHCVKEGNITTQKLLAHATIACFGYSDIPAKFLAEVKIGRNHFFIYHVNIQNLGDLASKIIGNPELVFEEIKKLKSGKVIRIKGKAGTFKITKANRIGIAALPKMPATVAA